MMQYFLRAVAYLRGLVSKLHAIENYADEQDRWRRDPLSHPDIATMNAREVADLPFEPRFVCRR